MDISNKLPSSGINSVLIIDDDTKIFYSKDSFLTYGVEEEIINKLDDEDDPNTSELIELLDRNNHPSDTLEERIKSFSFPEIENEIPEHFKEKIVTLIKDKHNGLYHRIETVKNALTN
ncbi:TPA: hypothetical protein H2W85_000828 [Salmonella enterica]|nr:hypothetical protein [Salmonella enterica]